MRANLAIVNAWLLSRYLRYVKQIGGEAHVARVGGIFGNEKFQCYWGLGVHGQGDGCDHLFSKEIYAEAY